MPFGMSTSIQAVVICDNVYVGGGYNNYADKRATVMVYSLRTGSWRTLPPYNIQWFGMAAVNNQLVLVGGHNRSIKRATNVLGVWDEGSQTWTHPFPGMPTSRSSPSVVSYQKWLIVAGGVGASGSRSKTVELLHSLSGQWYEGSSLPDTYSEISSTICGNMWYLSERTNNKHVFSVCLDELISQAVLQSAGITAPLISALSPWQTLTVIPLTHSTLLVLNGALLAVGGESSSAIHLYVPTCSSRSWVKVGDLPTARWECACAVLPDGELFVAGGCTTSNTLADNCLNIATLHT